MKKKLILFFALFFMHHSHAMHKSLKNSIPDGLPSLFFNDPEVSEWMDSSLLLEIFSPQKKDKEIIRTVASLTKRSCEIIGAGIVSLVLCLASTHEEFSQSDPIPFFDNDTCPLSWQ
ncbi:MAG TPA: hypothetical protein VI521_02330 [Candidatus Babeliales bacterium]|nr:hypothetical protein [Candidatus Babeliales bacterium]